MCVVVSCAGFLVSGVGCQVSDASCVVLCGVRGVPSVRFVMGRVVFCVDVRDVV